MRPLSASSRAATAPRRPYYPQLDGVRALAILGVLFGHLLESTFASSSPIAIMLGECGVLLFFVLSGYLITDLLLREERSRGRVDFLAFYVRRALRLLPAMFLFVGTVAVLKALGLIEHESWLSFGAAILYVRNVFGHGPALSHLWSLSLEEQFYLTWPLLFVVLRDRREIGTLVILAGMALWRGCAIVFHLTSIVDGRIYQAPWFRYDSILYGCFLAIAASRRPERGRGSAIRRLCHPVLSLGLLGAVSAIPPMTSLYPLRLTLQSIATAAFLWFAIIATPEGVVYRALATRPMRYLGRISYSLYLWQGLFVWLPGVVADEKAWLRFRSFPLNFAATFAVAIASYELLERPFLRLKDRFGQTRVGTGVPSVPSPAGDAS